MASGDENATTVNSALAEATGKPAKKDKNDVSGESVVVLGSGNLGLVYLMDEPRRMTLEEIDARHPDLVPALRSHPHVGWLLVRSAERGPLVLGAGGSRELATGRVEGDDPLAHFGANAPAHLLRSDSFEHVPDILVGSFYDPSLQDACAFEELISFHGGLGGPQTRPFIFAPVDLPEPDGPLVGAASVHTLLSGWRALLNGAGAEQREPAPERAAGVPA